MATVARRTWPAEGIRRVEIRGRRLAARVRPGDRLAWDGPTSVEAEQEGNSLVLRTPHHRRWSGWIGPVEELLLTLPPTVRALFVRTTGDVDVQDLDLEAEVHLRAGDLRASRCRGRWRIQSGAGDVTVVDPQGDLDVQTGAGEVTVRGGRLRQARIRTGAGDVRLKAWIDVAAEVTTGAGSVDLRPRHAGGARIRARSGFGGVVLDVSGVRSGRMELQTGAGGIHLAGGIHVGRRGGLGQRVVDVLGPGEGVIEVTTGAGDIRVVGYGTPGYGTPAWHGPAGSQGRAAGPDPGPGPVVPPASPPAATPPDHPFGSAATASAGPEPDLPAAGTPAGAPQEAGLPSRSPSPPPFRSARQVLEALARGELTVEEADRWLAALEGTGPGSDGDADVQGAPPDGAEPGPEAEAAGGESSRP